MEGQQRAFQLLEGASLQRPYPLTLQAWGRPRPSTKGKAKAFHPGERHVDFIHENIHEVPPKIPEHSLICSQKYV